MKKKLNTTIPISLFMGSLLLFGAGCSKKTVVPPPPKDTTGYEMTSGNDISYPTAEGGYSEGNLPVEGSLDDTAQQGAAGGAGGIAQGGIDQQSDEYKRLHGRSSPNLFPIYFDFDQASVRSDMAQVMNDNAEYLKTIPNATVVLEGNSDERGTNEYNLALGERRAINTQQYLVNLGIDTYRIQTLSYGEEQPVFLEQEEDAYDRNRRVDFVVK